MMGATAGESPGVALASPFIGFTVGTALFGITLTQGYRYFLRYPKDPLSCKIKVAAVCRSLDEKHLELEGNRNILDLADLYLILGFSVDAGSRNYTTSTSDGYKPVLVWIVGLAAVGLGVGTSLVFIFDVALDLSDFGLSAFCYELQKLDAILSFVGNSEWIVYMGFGATTAIDIVITAMLCLVLYKTRMDIGVDYISRRSDRLFRSLIVYAVATGIVTSSISLLVIIVYVARPNSLFYLGITFSAPRIYTNSVFVMLDSIRRHVSGVDVVEDLDHFRESSELVFRGPVSMPSIRARTTRRSTTNVDTSLASGAKRAHKINLSTGSTDSDASDGDIEAQKTNLLPGQANMSLYSPYYSPLEARKRMNSMFKVQAEPEEIGDPGSWINVWKDTSFLPSLQQSDIHQAIQLILQAYAPTQLASPDDLKRLQHELFEIQKRPEAWGLVIPLLEHVDQNVQFFGAHTAQVKIARDWDSFPKDHAESLRDLMVQLTAHSIASGRSKFILRKLFVALTSLALKLVPGHPTKWPEWIMACVTMFSGRGAPTEQIHDFLGIVAEEVPNADLLGASKAQMSQSLMDAIPMVVQAVTSSISPTTPPHQIQSGLRCLQAWMTILPTNDLTPIIPILISLLNPGQEDVFIAASDALQEILSKSALSDGSGSRTLTEPLLFWLDRVGTIIVREVVSSGEVSPVARSTCKLIAALGDHSTSYLAANVASRVVTSINVPPSLQVDLQPPAQSQRAQIPKSHLVHSFLRLMLAFTGLPGYFGVDEDESEMTLGFWYLFQEALWSVDYHLEDASGDVGEFAETAPGGDAREKEQVRVAKAVYIELVQVLRRKVAFPPQGSGWSKDQVEKFQVYRRDVGDTLINAYYVLREDMLGYYVNDLVQRLNAKGPDDGWQDVEATLHCIMSIQEAIDLTDSTPHLPRLFGPEVLGRLPQDGQARVRRTMLGVIGAYSSWFASLPNHSTPPSRAVTPGLTPTATPLIQPTLPETSDQSFLLPHQPQPQTPSQAQTLLLAALSYVANALPNQGLCLQAGVALRNLCDANRKALAPHIAAFGELHNGLGSIPDSEKGKVLQSIASVVQALPPEQEIPPLEAIVNPIVQKLAEALQLAASLPEDARALAILQLEILSGVAKGLTHISEGLLESELEPAELEKVNQARQDMRMVKLRESVFGVVRSVVEIWSADVGIGHALSDLFKSITSLPNDATLISLPAGPLLELVCMAIQRQVTAAWISLATILIAQLNPPVFALSLKPGPKPEAEAVVHDVLPVLLRAGLGMMGVPGAMESNPDIVQEFFVCMDRVAQDFTGQFYQLPEGALDTLMQCAITALSLQERYSLVAASNFLSSLIHRSALTDELMPHKCALVAAHGRSLMHAVLQGFAGIAPRSVVPNLIEVLGTLMSRAGTTVETNDSGTASEWMKDIIFSPDFIPSKATIEDKEKFVKGIVGSRSLRRTRDAANQFTLVARGLEGSNFGYASVTM
ncbi:hypothetical protein NP233_g2568 [Leucocoprinus birnbaumii]|uniref:DUF6534 domain-containing protein n=1 Tax=Leucocoprinus birnbaumii TaxID=56174 RepID=A0AAD5VYQ9_9AGAR|nr:hypothetical protein NP233_g2568 [Leucocoprinus birnbaumii]